MLQVEVAEVELRLATGEAVRVSGIAIGKAASVELDMLQAGAAGVCSGSSTVLAAVTIVVEHRARLSVVLVDRRHNGTIVGRTVGRAGQGSTVVVVAVRCKR